ncbi:dihydroorotate dehydrogenase electron transfer subunit [Carboxydothermus ferrireducens]|uniref:Dihydroorotate dehydrogenase B (NAD(+)), electron transfer subunit n=1 Tax=Carboxydothermus ferrireducens DSM 11255 TaxID=1119529 RepID=A0ABX2RBI4_9THEO|nr:dihydroorotate dehydrogenase electron transfer subunit [Carboxydothermus ferrireducens]NYE58269.1 dihydroorotate dehydrogenase electron transfer subunit [Carboxydothermus ferrireducens DSM 11255]
MQDLKGLVVENIPITKEIYKLQVSVPEEILPEIVPGSFAMVKVEAKGVFLRRPFSFADVDLKTGLVTFYIKTVGQGTRALRELPPGQEIRMLLPLGRGFTVMPGKSLLVAGGIGIAPLKFLAKEITKNGGEVRIIYGVKNTEMFIPEIVNAFEDVEVYAEVSGLGKRGLVLDGLKSTDLSTYNQIYLCGPEAMLKAAKPVLQNYSGLIEVSLESFMACGFGACLGCAVKVFSNNEFVYKKVCKDGPVFNFKEVVL